MKRNAIARIIFFSLAILVLLGILLTGLGVTSLSFDPQSEHVYHSDVANQGDALHYDAGSISKIEIDWASGTIQISPDPTVTDITVRESGDPDTPMACGVSGNTLKINFSRNKILRNTKDKTLLILVPENWDCDSLEIDTASADVSILNMRIGKFDFDGASGMCYLENCILEDLDLDTASGDLVFTGSFSTLDFDSASANCTIKVYNTPRSIDMDAASGDLKLYLPENCGFTCSLDGLSGVFHSEFDTTLKNGHHVYGDGSCRIEVDALSGQVSICKYHE